MKLSKTRLIEISVTLARYGATAQQVRQIVRDAGTLRRWAELQCGTERGAIMYDDTERPYWQDAITGRRSPVRDRYTPARRRLEQVAQQLGARLSINGDPRGAVVQLTGPDGGSVWL